MELQRETADLLDRLRETRPALAEATFQAVCREVAAYGRLDERGQEQVRQHILEHLETSYRYLSTGRGLEDSDYEFVRRLALRAARAGFDRDEILSCYRVGPRVQVEWIVRSAGRGPGSLRAALSLTTALIEYAHRASSLFSDEYQKEQRRLEAETTLPQRELLEDLLAGQTGPAIEARSRRFGLRPDVAHRVAVVRARHLTRAGAAINQLLRMARAPALTVTRGDELVIVTGASAPLRQALEREAAVMLLSAGISLVVQGLDQVARAYAQARQALALAPAGGVMGLADLSLFEYLVAGADDTAPQLAPAGLERLDEVHRRTLLAFAECDLNAGHTATRLGVHPNTVHYRLHRIEKLTRRDVRRFWDLVGLVAGVLLLERAAVSPRS